MKFRIEIIETTEKLIEIEAKDYKEAKRILDSQRDNAGIELQQAQTIDWVCEVTDEKGKTYPKIRWI